MADVSKICFKENIKQNTWALDENTFYKGVRNIINKLLLIIIIINIEQPGATHTSAE